MSLTLIIFIIALTLFFFLTLNSVLHGLLWPASLASFLIVGNLGPAVHHSFTYSLDSSVCAATNF